MISSRLIYVLLIWKRQDNDNLEIRSLGMLQYSVITTVSGLSMAEAHSAVAFTFSVTPEGLDFNVNHEALHAVWLSGLRSWKKRFLRVKNHFINGVYPASPASWVFTLTIVLALYIADVDPSFGLIHWIGQWPLVCGVESPNRCYLACLLYATVLWLSVIMLLRYTLMALLTYKGWMYEERGKVSLKTKIWVTLVKLLGSRQPLLYSYQASLPKLPVPDLDQTMKSYLRSVRSLMNDEKYKRMEKLVAEFKSGLGVKLQRYLVLKSWWASNYDAVFTHPTKVMVARAANATWAMLQYRRQLEREELKPILLNNIIPLCSWQYERQFNTTRVPGIETDTLVHYKDSSHVTVYHRGRFFKMYIRSKAQLLSASQIEYMLQKIVDDPSPPADGEQHLAALTAGDRIPWAKTRQEYFKKGINKNSLDAIEKAAFFLVLDEEEQDFDRDDPSKLDKFGHSMLHGKGYDRWFDKSFTVVVCANGRIGFNGEHSWADAPISAHLWEYTLGEDIAFTGADAPVMGHLWECSLADDVKIGYSEDGHTKGELEFIPPNPIRLQWEIPQQCQQVIERSLAVANDLIADVDLHLIMHDSYGKGFMKKCHTSPDAFIQMALQLAYYRDAGKFCLTYEASMTRLYREGRTETVRSCTIESCEFVQAMDNKTKTNKERIALLAKATKQHQNGYRDAMCGKGIDRHLFCLYVVSKYLGIDSPFLKEVLSEPWRLSTSQTPHQQTDKLDLAKHPELISAGGGFGPVADDGYGVSYIIAGEDVIFFHISSKRSCPETDSTRFGNNINRAFQDMRKLFENANS
ncbi:hypothetical protein LSH36_573g01026 [Paralvinella palmiformis]|uniref:Carnitine O-palmitoyltransferase n=2 Tax=Paralvinella palmiformis TaxID=53620 RepID=A0AAD9J5W8_9ANNE|nr:hypothetical protein LSH36_573g01026 [Paralvinella palmiformis]